MRVKTYKEDLIIQTVAKSAFRSIPDLLPVFLGNIQDKMRKFITRNKRITLGEYDEFRGNSFDFKVMVPSLSNKALVAYMENCLNNCSIEITGRYSTNRSYDDAIISSVPVLLDRIEELEKEVKFLNELVT